jgi:hypothetical protein
MSRDVEIIFLVNFTDDPKVEELTFWLGTPEAVDPDAMKILQDIVDHSSAESDENAAVTVPLDRVGNLMPLNGAVGEELWGGSKATSVSVWGGVTSNMHWGRFLDRVKAIPWTDPERMQILMKDDGDTYFRMYMFRQGKLINVVPAPEDGGYDRPW